MEELTHQIHTSERKAFRGCRRRWDLRYRQWYQPITPIKPLEFGIAYHKAMEVLYSPDMWLWDREIVTELAIQAFVDTCKEQLAAYKEKNDWVEDEVQADYDERIVLGKGMIRYYATLMPEMDKGLTPVQVEISFTVPVRNPYAVEGTDPQLYCKCVNCKRLWMNSKEGIEHHDKWQETFPDSETARDTEYYWKYVWQGLPVVYRGRIDCLMRDEYGEYWIYDWKTCARFMQDRDKWLDLDDQILSYGWALRVILGLPIVGFIYHEQLKAFPQVPAKLKTTRKGCSYSTSKSQPTEYATFYNFVSQYDAGAFDAGCYDDYLEWLKSDEGGKFHVRHKLRKTDHEFMNVANTIYLEALDITDPDIRIYPNATFFGCQWCAYHSPCLGMNRGDDWQISLDSLFTREAPYYMIASTDTRGNQ